MSDSTARLKLPEIAQMQEMTSAQINDALLQLDALCSPSVLGLFVNNPPASPTDGDIYVTGGAPTGAWSGYAYKIAYCVDGGWRMFTPFDGLMVHRGDSGSFTVYLDGQWTELGAMLAGSEVNIASAATCDLAAAGGLRVQITGTTTITSFGMGANALRLARFADSLTLTHDATSLILPGGANIVTRPGDCATIVSDGSGNWRCLSFARADGRMVNTDSPTFTGTMTGPDGGHWSNAGLSTDTITAGTGGLNVNVSGTLQYTGAWLSLTNSNASMGDQGAIWLTHIITDTAASKGRFTFSRRTYSGGYLGDIAAFDMSAQAWLFSPAYTEVARITPQGLFVGTSANGGWSNSAKLAVVNTSANVISAEIHTAGNAYLARTDNVNGNLFSSYYNDTNVGSITTDGTSTAYNTTSDARLKTVLPVQTDYGAAIKALWVGDFAWKANGEKAFGVLAQQAYEHMPHHMGVSKPADEESQWHASSEPFGHLALWGVKDLYRMIDALSARVAALEASHAAG